MKNKITLLAAVLATASAYAVNSDPATLFLWDGVQADNTAIKDQQAGDTQPGLVGAVGFSGSFGAWTLNVDTGTTKPVVLGATAANPIMDLSFQNTTASGASTLGVAFFDDNYNPANLNAALAHIGGTLPAGASLTYATYVNVNNASPTFKATGGQLDLTGWTLLTTHSFVGSGAGTGNGFSADNTGGAISGGSSNYSLLQVLTITTTTAVSGLSGNGNLHTVPDGGTTMMLLGSGLTALALVRRSFKAKA